MNEKCLYLRDPYHYIESNALKHGMMEQDQSVYKLPSLLFFFSITFNCRGMKTVSHKRLTFIDENGPVVDDVPPVSCPPPETPTETMEFLARSWSLSAMELSKALTNRPTTNSTNNPESQPFYSATAEVNHTSCAVTKEPPLQPVASKGSPPVSPRDSEEMKDLLLLHQALNPEFLSGQQLIKHGLYNNMLKGRTIGRRLKDQKEKRKQEIRTHNAQLHAAVSVAGVAAAVAALAASDVMSPQRLAASQKQIKTSVSIASAAALVASHCIEVAEDMGADHDQILTVVNSAINSKTNGDIMTLTAGAATALRAAATLSARLQKGYTATTFAITEGKGEEDDSSTALTFVYNGGELLKRTRKGDLHWKLVSFNINSNWQVIAKMKSKHMAGTFTKKKKCVVSGVFSDIPAWPKREMKGSIEQKSYFGIRTSDRIIEFECKGKFEKHLWIEGIRNMMNCCANLP